jgi:hypothetical protein
MVMTNGLETGMSRLASGGMGWVLMMALTIGSAQPAGAQAQACSVPAPPALPATADGLDLAAFEALKLTVWAFEDERRVALDCLNRVIFRETPASDAEIAAARSQRDALFPRDGAGRLTDPVNDAFSRLTEAVLASQDRRAREQAEAEARASEARATNELIDALKASRAGG